MTAVVRTHVLLHEDALRALDELAGPRGRGRLIEELIFAEAQRRRASVALAQVSGTMPAGHPTWATEELADQWIREQRAAPDPWSR